MYLLIRPDDDFGVESLSHFVSSFLTKKNITWHVNDHFLINNFDNNVYHRANHPHYHYKMLHGV